MDGWNIGIALVLGMCTLGAVFYAVSAHRRKARLLRLQALERRVSGRVVGKFVCKPVKNDNRIRKPAENDRDPIELMSDKHAIAEARATGKCILKLSVECVDGQTRAMSVSPQVFDAVEEGSLVLIRYLVDERTNRETYLEVKPMN